MLTGDSVAWTVGYYRPDGDDVPPGIASIDSRGIIGCGLLSSEGWGYPGARPGDVFGEAGGGTCRQQPRPRPSAWPLAPTWS